MPQPQPHARGDVADLCVGLSPQRIDVGMLAGHLDRRIGSAADKSGMPPG